MATGRQHRRQAAHLREIIGQRDRARSVFAGLTEQQYARTVAVGEGLLCSTRIPVLDDCGHAWLLARPEPPPVN